VILDACLPLYLCPTYVNFIVSIRTVAPQQRWE